MDVIVHYWAGLVKIRKFKTSEIKIFNLYLKSATCNIFDI